MRRPARRWIAHHRLALFAGQESAQLSFRVAREELPQVLFRRALDQVLAQEPFYGLRRFLRRAAKANRTRECRVLANAAAYAEIVGIYHLAVDLYLLAFHADVRQPVLPATVRASGHIEAQLLVELRYTLLQLFHQPAGERFGLGDGQL